MLFSVRLVEPKSNRYVLFCCVSYLAFYETDVKENTVVAKVQVINLSASFRNFDYTFTKLCFHHLASMWVLDTCGRRVLGIQWGTSMPGSASFLCREKKRNCVVSTVRLSVLSVRVLRAKSLYALRFPFQIKQEANGLFQAETI